MTANDLSRTHSSFFPTLNKISFSTVLFREYSYALPSSLSFGSQFVFSNGSYYRSFISGTEKCFHKAISRFSKDVSKKKNLEKGMPSMRFMKLATNFEAGFNAMRRQIFGGRIPLNRPLWTHEDRRMQRTRTTGFQICLPTQSPHEYEVGEKKWERIYPMYINGISNLLDEAQMGAKDWSQRYLNGAIVHGVYNPSHGLPADTLRVGVEAIGYGFSASRALPMHWEAIQKRDPKAIIWLNCFSEGSMVVYRAIESSPKKMQNWLKEHLIVDAYGGIKVIPQRMCLKTNNYVSTKDIFSKTMTLTDPHRGEIQWVEAKEGWPDHAWFSATYDSTKQERSAIMKAQLGPVVNKVT